MTDYSIGRKVRNDEYEGVIVGMWKDSRYVLHVVVQDEEGRLISTPAHEWRVTR